METHMERQTTAELLKERAESMCSESEVDFPVCFENVFFLFFFLDVRFCGLTFQPFLVEFGRTPARNGAVGARKSGF